MNRRPLVCPLRRRRTRARERFCPDCGLPLVYSPARRGRAHADPAHERARKIRPQYAEGPLVKVAAARHQAEAEILAGHPARAGRPGADCAARAASTSPTSSPPGRATSSCPRRARSVAREALGTSAPPAGVLGRSRT